MNLQAQLNGNKRIFNKSSIVKAIENTNKEYL